MLDVILDTLIDTIKLIPFLLITYLIMEFIEHKTSHKSKTAIKKSGKFGPLIGGILGIVPQCGFSAAAASLYSARIITLGTLIAVFLSTSDEMLPILISEAAPISLIIKVLIIKLVIGAIAGFIIDVIRKLILKKHKQAKNEEEANEAIGHMCEHDHCDCEHRTGHRAWGASSNRRPAGRPSIWPLPPTSCRSCSSSTRAVCWWVSSCGPLRTRCVFPE